MGTGDGNMTRPWRQAAVAAVLFGAALLGVARADGPAGNGKPIAVPNGTPKQLVNFMVGLLRQVPPEGETPANIREAVVKAADKVLAGQPGPNELYAALFLKTAVLSPQEAAAFENDMRRSGNPLSPQVVHVGILMAQLKAAKDDPEALRKKIDEVRKYLDTPHPPPYSVTLVQVAAALVERVGNDKFARQTCKGLANSLNAIPMGQDSNAHKLLTGVLNRLELPGHEMLLEGKTLDGKNFKLTSLKGKVVLVAFWAAGHRESMEEMKNVKQQYAKHRDQGFEVVGINLNSDGAAALAQFYKKSEITWTNCRDQDATRPMADYYGVTVPAVPMLILVGRDLKVLSLHAKGPDLGSLIDQALAGTLVVKPEPEEEKPAAGDTAEGKKARAKAKEMEEQERKAEEKAARKKKAEEFRAAHAPKFRQWSDTSGSFHRTAKFRGLANRIVKLELEDGSVISVPLEKLSDDDQKYIRQRTR